MIASAVVSACSTAAAHAATSPSALRASIVAAIKAQRSVHYVTTYTDPDWRSTTVVADIGAHSGIQRLTMRRKGAVGRTTILLVPGTAYVRGNATALHDYWGYSAKQASHYRDRWISIPKGEFDYSMVVGDVTLRSFIADHVPEGRLSIFRGTVGGQKIVGLRGTNAVQTQTLYVRSTAQPLPLEATTSYPGDTRTE